MSNERVAMGWPPGLRQRVWDRVGRRGLSRFVVDAVHAKLEQDQASVAAVNVEAAQATARHLAAVAESADADDADAHEEEEPEPFGPAEALEAKFDAATRQQRVEHVEKTFGLQRASELAPPAPAAPTAEAVDQQETAIFCEQCHSPLIGGECWACAM